ncbi:MAG: hypothetical protein OXJ36_17240, partial [bacterium]|nr:hypothetical protein [bacterium]
WWLVAGGWWLVAGGWWLVAGLGLRVMARRRRRSVAEFLHIDDYIVREPANPGERLVGGRR